MFKKLLRKRAAPERSPAPLPVPLRAQTVRDFIFDEVVGCIRSPDDMMVARLQCISGKYDLLISHKDADNILHGEYDDADECIRFALYVMLNPERHFKFNGRQAKEQKLRGALLRYKTFGLSE